MLFKYAGLFITVERFLVGDDFPEVEDRFSGVSGKTSVVVAVITDWEVFLNFPSIAVQMVVRGGTRYPLWLDTSIWKV